MIAKKSAPAAPAKPVKAVKAANAEKNAKPAVTTAKAIKAAGKAAAPETEVKRGRKPKEVEAKKPAAIEEDFSDIEADLEGEPEVETPAVAGDEVKVKFNLKVGPEMIAQL